MAEGEESRGGRREWKRVGILHYRRRRCRSRLPWPCLRRVGQGPDARSQGSEVLGGGVPAAVRAPAEGVGGGARATIEAPAAVRSKDGATTRKDIHKKDK